MEATFWSSWRRRVSAGVNPFSAAGPGLSIMAWVRLSSCKAMAEDGSATMAF